MNRRQLLTLGCAAALIGSRPAMAGSGMFCKISGAALDGFDPVTYFSMTGPRRGRRDLGLMWKGATWYFVEPHHRAMFEANPWPLAPRYGGYCAHAMSKGRLVPGDPLAWSVASGRLYVMANLEARDMWLAHMDENVARANTYWPAILRG